MTPIRLALVNDYEIVVRGLATMLRSYDDVARVVELDANTTVGDRVDIALYDSFAATQADRGDARELASHPLVDKLVVYSWNVDDRLVTAALANGAAGYISKSLPASKLVAGLVDVHQGRQQVHPGEPGARPVGGDWPGREEGLTQREAEVLALITQGFSNEEIAGRSSLSINSVKTYIRSCYRRIGVTSRSQAVLWGVEHGFRPDRIRLRPRYDR
ncbi:helix-turn-helix transcriptional regulator [Tomitella fengzijianii]|uniref:Response regulator transcription factor n=1 Tax=Tomitella fengzijianii TaxID=2597660 RepID=A0A516X5H7_9ACTN|nr:response regulator transcription factor [Tomitella fengzijianii]QDQ98316.1 response regulator transcription factor [Tomitella fengzijianii]